MDERILAVSRLDRMDEDEFYEKGVESEFLEAIARDDTSKMDSLIHKGASINALGKAGMRPLFWAFAKQKKQSFAFLLKKGAKTKIDAESGSQPNIRKVSLMEMAALAKDSKYLSMLLDFGADPNQQIVTGASILTTAVENRRQTNVKILVDHGANPSFPDRFGCTPLMKAIYINDFETANILIDCGANLSSKDSSGSDAAAILRLFSRQMESWTGDYWYERLLRIMRENGYGV